MSSGVDVPNVEYTLKPASSAVDAPRMRRDPEREAGVPAP
jgi:hypothetical protein